MPKSSLASIVRVDKERGIHPCCKTLFRSIHSLPTSGEFVVTASWRLGLYELSSHRRLPSSVGFITPATFRQWSPIKALRNQAVPGPCDCCRCFQPWNHGRWQIHGHHLVTLRSRAIFNRLPNLAWRLSAGLLEWWNLRASGHWL